MPVPHDPRRHHEPTPEDPTEFWERRYAEKPQIWSGRVNQVLAEVAGQLTPGRALDLGCGEGGDSLWLAGQGWEVTAVDISTTALERGRAAAKAAGIGADRIHWVAADLAAWEPGSDYELVSAFFLQSPVELDRSRILRAAAARIVPGGHLLMVSHAAPPPWASGLAGHEHHRTFLTPQQEIAALDPADGEWEQLIVETRQRAATGPDGQSGLLDDAVVLLRRNRA
ncbi:MAG: class I SAM-dependent methyltransferase [Propionibacteriaceae bacterium]|nr:class I SAM-dependent methyltransferase [Propionibacteriaceae bacterium]